MRLKATTIVAQLGGLLASRPPDRSLWALSERQSDAESCASRAARGITIITIGIWRVSVDVCAPMVDKPSAWLSFLPFVTAPRYSDAEDERVPGDENARHAE